MKVDYAENESINYIMSIPNIHQNEIKELDEESKEEFIKKWHLTLFPFDSDNSKTADNIIMQSKMPAFAYLKNIASVPLHLSNILFVTRVTNKIPSSKVQLYEQYIDIALNWHATGNLETDEIKIQLAYVAYYMMKRGLIRFSRDMLSQVLLKCSIDLDGEFRVPLDESNVDTFINELEERTCLIKSVRKVLGEDYYQFTHLQFQEYLAAYAIARLCSEDSGTRLELISQFYKMNSWREVIVLAVMLVDHTERNELIDFFIHEASEQEGNYHAINLLFEFITNGVIIKLDKRHTIYDLLFKEHITDNQINKICEFMDDVQAEDFIGYITEMFEKSTASGENCYSFALATIKAYEYIRENKNPLEEAEKQVIHQEGTEFVANLCIFAVLGWCKYSKINSDFFGQDIIVSSEFLEKIKRLLSTASEYYFDVGMNIKDIVLAEYIVDYSFFNKDVYNLAICNLNSTDKKLKNAAESVLSVFPLSYLTLTFCENTDTSKQKERCLEKYKECISDSIEASDVVFLFAVCALLGCWDLASGELINEFTDLEGYYTRNKSHVNSEAKARLSLLRRQISDLSYPAQAGMYLYSIKEFDSAKAAFTLAYKKGDTLVKNNLAYMLRRGEISEVKLEGRVYSVTELLAEGISANEPFSVINYALYEAAGESGYDYELGLSIVRKTANVNPREIYHVYNWWYELVESGETEGYIVIAWLAEAGLIKDFPQKALEELKQKI